MNSISKIIQIAEEDWGEIASPEYLAVLPFTAENLEGEFKLTTFEYWDDGLGTAKACVIAIGDSKYWLRSHPTEEESITNLMSVDIRSFEPDSEIALNKLLEALGIRQENLVHCRDDLGPAVWILFRLDDNGNEVEIFRLHNELAAKWLRDKYEQKGHKQTYSVAKASRRV